ncbi:hypothetical protein FACS1894186_1860 [Alphaproteobacteria bacterium]|nr:hypothetical protein FACS1894186_1860 [Alphaproteobacteria bacterium]
MAFEPRFLDDIRARVSLTAEIGKYVSLTKSAAGRWTGLCPFHKEKTGSFSVSDERGQYYCFGCHAHGDIFQFMVDFKSITFPEAVEEMAAVAGLPMPKFERRGHAEEGGGSEPSKPGWYEAMDAAAQFFRDCLTDSLGAEALAYFRRRRLTDETIARFGLGYAPGGGRLTRKLHDAGVEVGDSKTLGLVRENAERGELYDGFRERAMFPIANSRGRVVGFGGRILGAGEPKYLNSPDTPIFHKGELLYALHLALPAIRERKTVLAVEGYMDVIALHQAGFGFAVAPLGTALGEGQIAAMFKYCDDPILCFDGDLAGMNAALRAAVRALGVLRAGKTMRFLFLPDGLDPDEFLAARGADAFAHLLEAPEPLAEVLWRKLAAENSLATPEGQAGFAAAIDKLCGQIADESVRRFYAGDFRRRLNDAIFQRSRRRSGAPPASLPKTAIAAGEHEGRMAIAYLLAFSEWVGDWLESYFGAASFGHERIDAMLSALAEEAMIRPDHTNLTLQAKFPEAVEYVRREMVALQGKTHPEVMADMAARKKAFDAARLEAEVLALARRLADLDADGFRRYALLRDELARLKEES